MRRSASLARRLFLVLAVGAVALWLVAATGTSLLLRQQLDAAFDSGLRETAERLLPLAAETLRDIDGDNDGVQVGEIDEGGTEATVYQVRNAAGRILMRSAEAPHEPFPQPLTFGFANAGDWRVFTLGDSDSALFVQVGEPQARRDGLLWGSLLALLLPVLGLVPLIAIGLALAIRSGLAPVRRLSLEIAERAPGDMKPLDVGDVPTELTPMADAVQALIERLDAALRAEREFAANAAHELRTPIAGALAQTQLLITALEGQPPEARARHVEQTLHRLRQLTERLLQLSRADAGIALSEPRDLLPALKLMVADAKLSLTIAPGATLIAPMDVDAFGIAIRNLLENAHLHGSHLGPTLISVPAEGIVEVENGYAGDDLRTDELVKRFKRGDTKASGSGLGLAIVDALMRQIGGELELSVSRHPDAFKARLVFSSQANRSV